LCAISKPSNTETSTPADSIRRRVSSSISTGPSRTSCRDHRPTFGGQTLVAPLRWVLVRAPVPADLARWRGFGWLAEPDPAIAAEQHEALCELLRGAGAEVVYAQNDVAGDPDAVYGVRPGDRVRPRAC